MSKHCAPRSHGMRKASRRSGEVGAPLSGIFRIPLDVGLRHFFYMRQHGRQRFEKAGPENPMERIEFFHDLLRDQQIPVTVPHDMSEFPEIVHDGMEFRGQDGGPERCFRGHQIDQIGVRAFAGLIEVVGYFRDVFQYVLDSIVEIMDNLGEGDDMRSRHRILLYIVVLNRVQLIQIDVAAIYVVNDPIEFLAGLEGR